MNKKLKVATVAVSVIMAGTMAFGMFGCTGGGNGDSGNTATVKPSVDENGKLKYTSGTELKINIIDSSNADRKISYDSSQIATSWTGLDGTNVTAGTLKPAWQTFSDKLNIKFKDVAQSGRSGDELGAAIKNNEMANYDLMNASVSQIMQNTTALLDISQYLDYMPNYKAFLQQNPIVQYSLTMSETGAMYNIPYFDGNDDIEKYEMVQREWVKTLLDSESVNATTSTATFKAQATAKGKTGTSASATAFMGTTGEDSWVVETTDPANESGTIYVKLDYAKVIAALKDTTSALYTAIKAALPADKTPQSASGNIVDIQNQMINDNAGEVSGGALAKVLREYIKVAYYKDTSATGTFANAMYTTTLSDVFISSSAAWDADLMTAMYRCVVTNYNKVSDNMGAAEAKYVWALSAREGKKAQRANDLVALAGELYGVRGLESRLEYTYVNSKGELADARTNEKAYDAAAKMNDLVEEGLVLVAGAAVNKVYAAETNVTFMLHDYVQTQTTDGAFSNSDNTISANAKMEFDDFAPIVTPVSRWDTNDDGTAETVMRFTESWRSVKNSGVCISKSAIGNDSNKLSAVLAFIDYLYSNDGQIVGSYGSQASGKTAADGYWYGNAVTATIGGVSVTNGTGDLEALKTAGVVATNDGTQYFIANTTANAANRAAYFMFDNKIYTGLSYKDRQIPVMTDNNYKFFLGQEVTGSGKMDTNNTTGYKKSHAKKYTDYARGVVGAALPIGNKDQGFEYQCSAASGIDGANVVATALNNGTIKHVTQMVDSSNWWYTEAATMLPVTVSQANTIKNQVFLDGSGISVIGIYNATSTAGVSNVFIDLVYYGYDTDIKIGTLGQTSGDYAMQANASALITYIKSLQNKGLESRLNYYKTAWNTLKTYYKAS